MKRPSISFNTEAVRTFLLNHVEKIVVGLTAALACTLLWGGIDALRTKSVRREHRPESVVARSTSTTGHIDRVPRPPDDVVGRKTGLAAAVEPWLRPQPVEPTDVALLDKPLVQELSKRTKPDVYPIEELQAVAGIAVLAISPRQPGGGRDIDPASQAAPQPPAAAAPAAPPAAIVQVRIAPYVVVTGLVPFRKQAEHYRQRFGGTSHRDPKIDEPIWSLYLIERCVGPAGGPEKWEKIDVPAARKRFRENWLGPQSDSLPTDFLLADGQVDPKAVADAAQPGAGYCSPLPQLAKGTWGVESLHPRFLRELRSMAAEQQSAKPPEGSPAAPPPPPRQPDYRLFRFVDMDVESGKTYRYRVRLSVRNPNHMLPAQHLADAALAKDTLLASGVSNTTAPVTVPGSTTILARPKADTKRAKTVRGERSERAEILVLGENPQTGDYSLSSLITEVGGLINVDRRLNKPGETRTRGEEIFTNRVLIDMIGRQEDRDDGRPTKTGSRPEPIEMLLLREDGSFELVTTAESQSLIERHIDTLPAAEEPKTPRDRATDQPANANDPNPFGQPPSKK